MLNNMWVQITAIGTVGICLILSLVLAPASAMKVNLVKKLKCYRCGHKWCMGINTINPVLPGSPKVASLEQ